MKRGTARGASSATDSRFERSLAVAAPFTLTHYPLFHWAMPSGYHSIHTTMWFPRAFPNMRPEVAPVFGGWLLFCNVVVLLAGALWRRAELAAHGEDPTRVPGW